MKIDDVELNKAWQERNDLVYSHVQRYVAFITKAQDEGLEE